MAHAGGEGKPDGKDIEENQEPLNSKTWVLRVSIDCEGCKKKVNKILRKIEGVYRTDIDLKQQRVTVTGNVEAETLISKLEKKTGRRPTLLLPDKPAADKAAHKEKKQQKPKSRENQIKNSSSSNGEGREASIEGKSKDEKKTESREPEEAVGDGSSGEKAAGEGKSAGEGKEGKEEKGKQPEEEGKQSVTEPAGGQSAAPDTAAAAEKVGGSEKSGGGAGGKKKKPRGQNGNKEGTDEGKVGKEREVDGGNAPVNRERTPDCGSTNQIPPRQPVNRERTPDFDSTNHILPRQQFEPYPNPYPYGGPGPQYFHAPPLVEAVSYHTAHPTSTHGASYYASPNSFAYVHSGSEFERAPPYIDPYGPQPSGSSYSATRILTLVRLCEIALVLCLG